MEEYTAGGWSALADPSLGGPTFPTRSSELPSVAYSGGSLYLAWVQRDSSTGYLPRIYVKAEQGGIWGEVGTGSASGLGLTPGDRLAGMPGLAASGSALRLVYTVTNETGPAPDAMLRTLALNNGVLVYDQASDFTGTGIGDLHGAPRAVSIALDPSGRPWLVSDTPGSSGFVVRAGQTDAAHIFVADANTSIQSILAGGQIKAGDLILVGGVTSDGDLILGPSAAGIVIAGADGVSFAHGITIAGATGVTLRNLDVAGPVSITGSDEVKLAENTFRSAVTVAGATALFARDNRFLAADAGLTVASASSGSILSNTFLGSNKGLVLDAAFAGAVNDNDISGTQTGIVYAAAAALSGNRIHDNATGVSASVTDPASALGLVAGSGTNEIFRNTLGVLLAGGQLARQHIFENTTGASGTGTLGGSDTSSANLIADNQAGVANFSGAVQNNRIENNGTGVNTTSYLRIFGNQIVGNTTAGILVSTVHDVEIAGNTIHAPVGDAVRIVNGAYNVELISNIIWADSGYGIYVANDSQTGFWSDYNTLFAQGTGKIVYWTKDFFDILDWQDDVARFDLHSIGSTVVNPLWAVPHLDVGPDGVLTTRPVVVGQRLTDPSGSAGDPAGSFVGYRGVPNLAVNGSFESGLAGWTATSGGSATSNGPRAWDGSSVFLAAAGTQPVVQQTVDLVAAGFSTTALDSGSLQIAFGGRALLQQSSLSATASLVFFDQDGHPVGSTAVAPAGSDTGRWLRMFDTVDVPFGARSVELILGASGSAAFDAAFVGVITRGTSVDQGSGPMVAMPGDTTSGRLALRAPDLYVDWELNQPKFITWDSFGAATGQPVRIELWQDGPSGPAFRSVIAASAPDTGQFSWTPSSSGLTYGDHGLRVRIVGIANPSIYDMSTETFTVPQAGNVYYVNDAITTGDEYTTAIGSNRNTGKSPDSPKPNPDNLFRTYADLGAGSVVYVDTGSYPLIAPLQLSGTTDHGLGLHQGFQIIGPANASDAALLFPAIAGTGPAVIELDNSSFVTLRNLTLENSVDGLLIHNGSVNFTLSGITALNNSGDGILIQANSPTSTLTNITTGYSGGVGIEIDGSIASLDGLDSFDNTTGLLISGSIGRISSAVITANRQYGMDLSLGMDTVIEGSSISGNMVGVRINSANSATVIFGDADLSAGLGNIVTHNRLDGVDATGHVIVAGNTISDNGINGIVLNGPATAQANVVFGNTNGIIGGTGTQILYNQIYQNSGSGIVAAGSAVTATGNVIFSNNFGVSTSIFADHLTLSNNLVYANQTAAVTALASNLEVLNNTFYQVVGDVLDVNGAIAVDVRNNIIVALSGLGIAVSNASQAGFSSNYNLFNTGPSGRVGQWQGTRATLLQWQIASQLDANSIFGDPGFVSAAGPDGIVGYSAALNGSDDDFHEMSAYGTPVGGTLAVVLDPTSGLPVRPAGTLTNFATSSPAIDRGDPSVPVGAEPAPNGNFINIGAYGGTTQAARSASTYIRVVTPDGGETIGQGSTYAVTWRSAGFPGTVDLELFGTENDTSGAIPIATGVPNSGIYEWTVDPATVPLGVYRMQVSESADPHLAGISDSLFRHAPDPFLLCQ